MVATITKSSKLTELWRRYEIAMQETDAAFKRADGDLPDDWKDLNIPIAEEIIQVPAHLFADLLVKARTLFHESGFLHWDDPSRWEYCDTKDGLVLSLIEDIVRLEKEEGARRQASAPVRRA